MLPRVLYLLCMWCVLSSTDALTHLIKESDTALASAPRGLSAPITQECVSAPGRLTGPLLPSHVRVYFPFGRPYTPLSGDSAVRLCALGAHASRDECLGDTQLSPSPPSLRPRASLSHFWWLDGWKLQLRCCAPRGLGALSIRGLLVLRVHVVLFKTSSSPRTRQPDGLCSDAIPPPSGWCDVPAFLSEGNTECL